MALPDLIELQDAIDSLPDLKEDQVARLPAQIAAVSAFFRRYTGKTLTRQTYDLLATAGLDRTLLLPEYPVASILSVAADPYVVLSVHQADEATNQKARASIEAEDGVPTSVLLSRTASGVTTEVTVPIAGNPTIGDLAAAIRAVGSGWTAQATFGFEKWPTADFRPEKSQTALYPRTAGFQLWTTDLDHQLDEDAGVLYLGRESPDDDDLRFGPAMWADPDGRLVGKPNALRIRYVAGFDPVPADLQQAAIEALKMMGDRRESDSFLLSERTADYSWTARDWVKAMPPFALDTLAMYRGHA